jgi:hypothetical protein
MRPKFTHYRYIPYLCLESSMKRSQIDWIQVDTDFVGSKFFISLNLKVDIKFISQELVLYGMLS